MPRLLVVSTSAVTLRAFLLPFSEHFRRQGWQVDALAHGASTCPVCRQSFDHVWDIEWSRDPKQPQNILAAPRRVRDLVEEGRYDIVHTHTPVASFVTRYALRNARKRGGPKIIYTAHGFHFHPQGTFYKNAIFLLLERLAGRWTDYLVVINRDDMRAAQQYRLVPEKRVVYMPGIGIDLGYYSPAAVSLEESARIKNELRLRQDECFFLMIAEFNPGKRHRDAIEALKQLSRDRVHLVFAGTGPLMAQMRALANRLDLEQKVHFLGRRDDIRVLLKASVASVLPSEREGLPRSVMESLSMGVPAIGTNIRGMRDLLGDGAGLMVEVGDTKALAEAMAYVLDNPESVQQIAAKGQERIAQFDLQKILGLHEDLYDRVLHEDQI